MRVLISGANGLVGTEVIRQLEAEGHEALRLVRRKPTSPKEVEWNPAAGYIQEGIMETIDAVVNMAGATTGKIPWTAKYKVKRFFTKPHRRAPVSSAILRTSGSRKL